MLFGKMMLQHPNIIIMDEPTNHLDMESIESLNSALTLYDGTIIFSIEYCHIEHDCLTCHVDSMAVYHF